MRIQNKMTMTYLLFVIGCVLGIICVVFETSFLARLVVVLVVIFSAVSVLKMSHCPFCDKFGIRIRPFSKEKPSCSKCGKQL